MTTEQETEIDRLLDAIVDEHGGVGYMPLQIDVIDLKKFIRENFVPREPLER